jgi:hypothetical protein
MKLKRFRGSGIHGFLRFDISFYDDLTFLIGINGSGKTTVLNCITSLISPSFHHLAVLKFDTIEVDLEHENEPIRVSAHRTDDSIVLRSSNVDSEISYKPYAPDVDIAYSTPGDHEQEYYRDRESEFAGHPTPMFLGLDRRSQVLLSKRRMRRVVSPKSSRNVFSPFLSASLEDAASLAENRYQDMRAELSQLEAQLRRSLLLEFISLEPGGLLYDMSTPKRDDIAQIARMKDNIVSLAEVLALDPNHVADRMLPFLEAMQEQANKIPSKGTARNIIRNNEFGGELAEAVFFWNFNKRELKRIQNILDLFKTFNEKKKLLTEDIDRFLSIINTFLDDSRKHVSYDERGRITFQATTPEERLVPSLSSGEAQIFVILSHLFFNPAALGGELIYSRRT